MDSDWGSERKTDCHTAEDVDLSFLGSKPELKYGVPFNQLPRKVILFLFWGYNLTQCDNNFRNYLFSLRDLNK